MKRALEGVEGVKEAEVSFSEKKAAVIVENESATADLLCKALTESGFVGSSAQI